MTPSADELARAVAWVCRRHGLSVDARPTALRAIADDARRLALVPEDEPAAVFYALASRPKVLRAAWAPLTHLVALASARRLAPNAALDAAELRALRVDVAQRRASYDDVRAWFAARLRAP